ncbi:uncharacterized protein [Apostichopus japonicus]|uniref:uncharacterized protein n=1 Tax=Stichopus japonicus TaxID=307972 RepID=UPI003AB60D1E
MKRKILFQFFYLAIIIIDMTEAGRLCDFASKFPCKGSHCLLSLDKSEVMQEVMESNTAMNTEPQSTTPGKTMQDTKQPTTAVSTEPQSTTLGSLLYTCPPNKGVGTGGLGASDVYDAGHKQDVVYTMKPTGWPGSPFNVTCKMENDLNFSLIAEENNSARMTETMTQVVPTTVQRSTEAAGGTRILIGVGALLMAIAIISNTAAAEIVIGPPLFGLK